MQVVHLEKTADTMSLLVSPSSELMSLSTGEFGVDVASATSNDFYLKGEVLSQAQDPSEETVHWCMQPLFKNNQRGSLQVWQVGFDPIGKTLITVWGEVDGAKQKSYPPVQTNQSGRNIQEQALLEARQKFTLKWRDGYRYAGDEAPVRTGPQLANHYWKKKKKQWTPLVFPVGVQPKIDGARSLAWAEWSLNGADGEINDDRIIFLSRHNKEQIHYTHVGAELLKFFKYLPPGAGLDGEMFAPTKYFQDLISIIAINRKKRHKDADLVEYHVFDLIIPDVDYAERYNILLSSYRQYVNDGHRNSKFHILFTSIANSHDEIMKYHQHFVGQGYEGTIVRKLRTGCAVTHHSHNKCKRGDYHAGCTAIYKGNKARNDSVLKVKDFHDEEGTIIGYEEELYSRDGKHMSLIVFVVHSDDDKKFKCRPAATVVQRAQWWNIRDSLIGKRYTYSYFEKTKDGIPRHPTGIAIRDYE